jgi:hypothetical protein
VQAAVFGVLAEVSCVWVAGVEEAEGEIFLAFLALAIAEETEVLDLKESDPKSHAAVKLSQTRMWDCSVQTTFPSPAANPSSSAATSTPLLGKILGSSISLIINPHPRGRSDQTPASSSQGKSSGPRA